MPQRPIILFEGEEDRSFLKELLRVSGILDQFEFQVKTAGKDGFQKILAGLVTASHRAIIIVADNDGNPAEGFTNVQAQIGEAGYTIPQKPREIAMTEGLSPLSVLMIPWDDSEGCLETLCFGMANPKYKREMDCAEALVNCVGTEGWTLTKKSKLKMRGFLSAVCKSDPNTGLRYAWETDGGRPGDIFVFKDIQACTQIADFLRNFVT